MKLIFDRDGASPVRPCELCLQPMRFLGRHEECLLFRCEDCVLVSTDARADTTASRKLRQPYGVRKFAEMRSGPTSGHSRAKIIRRLAPFLRL
jgi:hypothetical protein